MREGDRRPVGGGAVIEAESVVSDAGAPEAEREPALERAAEARGWNPFILFLAVLTAASWAVLVAFESQLTFFLDEWRFLLDRRGGSVGDFLDPHNDHIALAPVSVYKLLLATFGMDSALPFQVASTLVFLLSAVLLFAYLRRCVGDWPALLGSALILFLGAAYIDLLWPFQIGFSGSIVAGLGALLALDRDDRAGDGIACALLVLSMAFSELGVPFVAGALVSILVGRRPRIRRLYVAFVPLALYGIWWLGWGHEAESAFSVDNVLDSPKFVFDAASQAAASLLGLATPLTGSGSGPVGLNWGRILLVAGIVLAIWRFRRLGRVHRAFWVALAIGASFWFLTAFNAIPDLREPTNGRHVYPGAVFLLLIAAEVLRGVRVSRRGLALGSAVTVLAVLSGLWFLHLGYSNILRPQSDQLRARLAAIEIARDRLPPGFAVVSSSLVPINAGSFLSAADAHGSPAYSESELASSTVAARAAADIALRRGLGIELGSGQGSRSLAEDRGGNRCRTVAATPTGATGLALGPGEVTLRPRSGSSTQVLLGRFADGFPVPLGQLRAGRASSLTLPVDRSPRPWRLGLRGSGRVTVCGQELVAVGRSAGGQQTTGPLGGNESAAKGERASPAAGTNETTSGPRPASSAANAFADGSDGGTSTLAPIVIAVGAVGLLLGGAWWARTGPLPLPTPPPAEARAAAEVAEAEESPGPAEAEVKTETTEEREAAAEPSDEPVTSDAAPAVGGASVAGAAAGAVATPRRDEARTMSEAAERDALTRLAEAERGGPIGGPAKEEGPHRMREADEAGDRAEGRYPIEAAPEEAEHDRLLEEPGTTERGLEGRREDEEELAQELEQAEQRLVAREERRLRALERAAARLEEVEGGAADAEARAVRAERLATLDAEGIELEGRFRETLDQIAEAERRASEAERRASEAERRAREAVERASRRVPSVAAEPPTPAPEPPAPAEEPSPPSPEPVAAERQAAGPVEHSAAAPNEDLIDLNEASYEQLRELGLSVAQTVSLLAYRERSRGFESLDELDRFPGFPRDLVAKLKTKVRV